MLINSRQTSYHLWTTCLVLLTALTLASCGQKAEDTTATNTPNQTESQATPASTSTKAAKDSTKTTTSKSSKTATLSAEAQKLGVKPTGTDCPANAPIKGNINKKQNKIFHEAKAKNYKEVKPEICFADVATAQKAGFKSAQAAKKE